MRALVIAITNARIYTGASQEWAEAVKIENGKFTYVGNAQDLKKHINSSTVLINMQGKVVLPGLIDAHTHPGYVAGASEMIELPHTGTKEDVFAAANTSSFVPVWGNSIISLAPATYPG